LNGGTVYAVEHEKVPGDERLAAIFRYWLMLFVKPRAYTKL
jgi:hypothetical protein